MKIDLSGVITALSLLGAFAVYLVSGWLIYRRGYELVMQRAAAEWEKLAQAQEKRIDALEREGARMREENVELKRINANLVSLNLELQTERQRILTAACQAQKPARVVTRRKRAAAPSERQMPNT